MNHLLHLQIPNLLTTALSPLPASSAPGQAGQYVFASQVTQINTRPQVTPSAHKTRSKKSVHYSWSHRSVHPTKHVTQEAQHSRDHVSHHQARSQRSTHCLRSQHQSRSQWTTHHPIGHKEGQSLKTREGSTLSQATQCVCELIKQGHTETRSHIDHEGHTDKSSAYIKVISLISSPR